MQENKRKRMRVEVRMPIVIRQHQVEYRVDMDDLSLKGLSCVEVQGLKVGENCQLKIPLGEEIIIEILGKVVRCESGICAIDFLKMEPESFSYLRNLVRMHSTDPDGIDHELSKPAF